MDKNKTKRDNSVIQTCSLSKAALTINDLHGKTLDPVTIMHELANSTQRVNQNDFSEIEQMLIAQAKALDYFFYETLNKLVGLGMVNHLQAYAEIALKAQNQSRRTLATLAEIKHPRRATFIKQQNNAINQQINGSDDKGHKISRKKENSANELIKEVLNEKMNIRRKAETSTDYSTAEALAVFDRAENLKRKKYKQNE